MQGHAALAGVARRRHRADVHAALDGLPPAVGEVQHGILALALSDRHEHVGHRAAVRSAQVGAFQHRQDRAAGVLNALQAARPNGHVPGEAVEPQHDDAPRLALLHTAHRQLQVRPVGIAAGNIQLLEYHAHLQASGVGMVAGAPKLEARRNERVALAGAHPRDPDADVERQRVLCVLGSHAGTYLRQGGLHGIAVT